MVHKFWKHNGETMTECMNRLKTSLKMEGSEKITYAGRLDPAASGFVLFLSGEDRYKKDDYLKNQKIYEIEIVLGVGTDTGDLLGIVIEEKDFKEISRTEKELQKIIQNQTGITTEHYPVFSARRIAGKSLWQHKREGRDIDSNLLSHTSEIYNIEYIESVCLNETSAIVMRLPKPKTNKEKVIPTISTISGLEIKQRVKDICERLSAHDFRQKEIIQSWEILSDDSLFIKFCLRVHAGSGSYMRTLAQRIGSSLTETMPAIASTIVRTDIGENIIL